MGAAHLAPLCAGCKQEQDAKLAVTIEMKFDQQLPQERHSHRPHFAIPAIPKVANHKTLLLQPDVSVLELGGDHNICRQRSPVEGGDNKWAMDGENDYEEQIRSWIRSDNRTGNLTFVRKVGELTELDAVFGVEAFWLKEDLKAVDKVDLSLDKTCVVHARMEGLCWRK